MEFRRHRIGSKQIAIIDIGTYKIRVGICSFKNGELDLIGYGEQRQNSSDIVSGELVNIEGICESILMAIEKAEAKSKVKAKSVIINIPFEEVFFGFNKINYKRKDKNAEIDKDELFKIIKKIEKSSLSKAVKDIQDKSGCSKDDLELIISNISKFSIDKKECSKPLGKTGEQVKINLLNIFISTSKYNLVQYIGNIIGKKIIQILPSEFSITHIFDKKNVVIVDLGNSHTSIIVKEDNNVIGANKITLGISDLIKNISKNHHITKIDVINSIEENNYIEEKEEFLEIFKEGLVMGLKEILGNNICPHKFFITGGGNNTFIRDYISEIDFNSLGLKMAKELEYIEPEIGFLDFFASKSNLNILSMIITTLDIRKKEKDPINESLKKSILELDKCN